MYLINNSIDFVLTKKSGIPTKNMKCTKSPGYFCLKPIDAVLPCNSFSINGTGINYVVRFSPVFLKS